jgi:hypothetical protein
MKGVCASGFRGGCASRQLEPVVDNNWFSETAPPNVSSIIHSSLMSGCVDDEWIAQLFNSVHSSNTSFCCCCRFPSLCSRPSKSIRSSKLPRAVLELQYVGFRIAFIYGSLPLMGAVNALSISHKNLKEIGVYRYNGADSLVVR